MFDTDWTDPLAAALEMVGNWERFESFGWADAPDPTQWVLAPISSRDDNLLAASNAHVIESTMREFDDVEFTRSRHWACGYVDNVLIRALDDNGDVTPAWTAFCELGARLADYPVLDESDLSAREYTEACEQIDEHASYAVGRLDHELIDDLPEDWTSVVFSHLWDENEYYSEDGGWNAERLARAVIDLGYAIPQGDN